MSVLSEKFDYLMSMTNTSNSYFAKSFNFDPSYISLLRNAKRKFPDDPGFLFEISAFFAVQIRDKRIESIASSAISDSDFWPEDDNEAGYLIREWLTAPSGSPSAEGSEHTAVSPERKTFTYYGSHGQRAAILDGLELLCNDIRPYKLMVYSDEPLLWFTEDKDFFRQWYDYCMRLINAGSTFTVIDCLKRDLNEMKQGFNMWIPLILTGKVTVYRCDALKNAFFDRTTCIAENKLAVIYNSVHSNDGHAISTLYLEKEAVDSMAYEFRQYLSLCSPLYYSYSTSDIGEVKSKTEDFIRLKDELFFIGSSPALFMLGKEKTEAEVTGPYRESLSPDTDSLSSPVTELLEKGHCVSVIITLPKKEDLINMKVSVPMGSLSGKDDQFFSPEEYLLLLEHMLKLEHRYPGFRLLINPARGFPDGMYMMLKPTGTAFLSTVSAKDITLCITDPEIISAIHRLLTIYISASSIQILNRSLVRKYIHDVRQIMKQNGSHLLPSEIGV